MEALREEIRQLRSEVDELRSMHRYKQAYLFGQKLLEANFENCDVVDVPASHKRAVQGFECVICGELFEEPDEFLSHHDGCVEQL